MLYAQTTPNVFTGIMTTWEMARFICETHMHLNTKHHFQFIFCANRPPSLFPCFPHFPPCSLWLSISHISSPNFHGFRYQIQLYWLTDSHWYNVPYKVSLLNFAYPSSFLCFTLCLHLTVSHCFTVSRFFDPDQSFGQKIRQKKGKQEGKGGGWS